MLGGFFEDPAIRQLTLFLGLVAFAGGCYLLMRTHRAYQFALAEETKEKARLFEFRKFRRRMVANSLIAAIGAMLAALYWIIEPRLFALMISLVLVSLLGVLGLAFLDLVSVGLRQIATPNDAARKALVQEYLRRREQKASEEPSGK